MILIESAFKDELEPIVQQLVVFEEGKVFDRDYTRGVIGRNEIVACSGMTGKVETSVMTQKLIELFHPACVFFRFLRRWPRSGPQPWRHRPRRGLPRTRPSVFGRHPSSVNHREYRVRVPVAPRVSALKIRSDHQRRHDSDRRSEPARPISYPPGFSRRYA